MVGRRTPFDALNVEYPIAGLRQRATSVRRLAFLRERLWLAVGLLVCAVGLAGSVVAAGAVARADDRQAAEASARSATSIGTMLQLALGHEADLLASTVAQVALSPRLSSLELARWARAEQAFVRYPEVLFLGKTVLAGTNPMRCYMRPTAFSPSATKILQRVIGVQAMPSANALARIVAGMNVCAGASGRMLLYLRDSGLSVNSPITQGSLRLIAMERAVYSTGVVPRTVDARRAAYQGLVTIALMPDALLVAALRSHEDTALTMRYSPRSALRRATTGEIDTVVGRLGVDRASMFRAGKTPAHASTHAIDLGGGWTVTVASALPSAAILAHRNALVTFAGGAAFSVLLGALLVVLTTTRARALRMVSQQTTALRLQAGKLQTTVDQLEKARGAKDTFIGMVSHEFRTPLTSIRGYTEMLAELDMSEEERRFLDVIDRSGQRLACLVEDVLLISKLQGDFMCDAERSTIELDRLVQHCIDATGPAAAAKAVTLSVDIRSAPTVDGSPERIGQAIDNLVSNAVKYTPEGGTVLVTLDSDSEAATLTVADTGIGIPVEDHGRMFDSFFRAGNAVASGIQGTGLGLTITRAIVEAHGGTISFESAPGAGTTFTVTLPATVPARAVAVVGGR